jgi:hypothetical protein
MAENSPKDGRWAVVLTGSNADSQLSRRHFFEKYGKFKDSLAFPRQA